MSGSIEGPLAKLSRAEGQLDVLKEQVEAVWPPRKAWPVQAEEHRGGLEYRFYLGELPAIEPEWGLHAGEIMFDLRSALDHLAYELHARRCRGNVPKRIEGATLFPIFGSPGDFRSKGYWRIKCLSQRDRRAIVHLQPYVTRNDRLAPTRVALSYLNFLHNIDKHRKLHLITAAQNITLTPHFPPRLGWQSHPTWGAVESQAHVDTWTFREPPTKVQDHRGAHIEITLQHGYQYGALVPLLRGLSSGVAAVLTRFSDRFPPAEIPANLRSLFEPRWS